MLSIFPQRQNEDIVLGRFGKFPLRSLYRVPASARAKHLYVIGLTGKGKSKLLEHILYQDIAAGRGCGLIDPHSHLARDPTAFSDIPGHLIRPHNSQSHNLGRPLPH